MQRLTLWSLGATLALGLALGGCNKATATDALDAAMLAIGDEDAFVQRCAPSEYNAALALLEQARQAEADGDIDEARELAEAARLQAERARELAEARREECLEEDADALDTSATDGADYQSAPQEVALSYDMTPVYFAFNENALTTASQETLREHADYLVAHPDVNLSLAGHCDDRGTVAYNMALGMRRAQAVRQYLERLGVDGDRLTTTSFGELQPADPTNYDLNRRVTFSAR